ncbi:MAG: RseA family anti-sigma factor [Rubrivivax sp.]
MSDAMYNPTPDEAARQLLSALTDGEADAAACAQATALWAASRPAPLHGDVDERAASWRSTWHAYQLIGDVLRSEDLAHAPDHDEAFLQRLRVRLADEPAVLAPAPVPAFVPAPVRPAPVVLSANTGARTARRWAVPAALAAGVMGLSTVLVSMQWRTPPAATPMAAATQAGVVPVLAARPAQAVPAPTQTLAAGGQLVRDAKLDRYLRAHREYGSAAPVSLPGGASRNIETVSFQP